MNRGTITLTTKRLILRKHIPEDALTLYENFGKDSRMFEFSGWNPYATMDMANETVREFINNYQDMHFYGWAIEHEGSLIGTIGAYDYDPETDSIEIGCSIERKSWSKGFAGEALAAVLDYLTQQEGIKTVKAWCASDNIGSQKIMERAGMRHVTTEPDALLIEGRKFAKMHYEYGIKG